MALWLLQPAKQEDELLLITSGGTMVRTRVKEVLTVGS